MIKESNAWVLFLYTPNTILKNTSNDVNLNVEWFYVGIFGSINTGKSTLVQLLADFMIQQVEKS